MTALDSVCVASTVRAYKATGQGETGGAILSWLTWAERWHADGVRFFLASQRDRHHEADLEMLADLVHSVEGTVWEFSIDEGAESIDNSGRLTGITMGRNLAHEFAQRDPSITHLLFLDTDVAPPVDAIERLLEVAERYPSHGLIGGDVPLYGLSGEQVEGAPPHWDLRAHWTSAGFLMVSRAAFRRLRWRWDLEAGCTDDPAFAEDAIAAGFGVTVVRHSVIGQHFPPNVLYPFQERGHRLSLVD